MTEQTIEEYDQQTLEEEERWFALHPRAGRHDHAVEAEYTMMTYFRDNGLDPRDSTAGREWLNGREWPLDLPECGGCVADRSHPADCSGCTVEPCSTYRPHPDLAGLNGVPFCVCGFERRQH